MKIYIVGVGMGNPKLLTAQALEAIASSGCLIGSRRMLDCFPESTASKLEACTSDRIVQHLASVPAAQTVSVLMSGDVGFYSGAKKLTERLQDADVEYLCGISSLQYLCSRVKTSWDDTKIISLHGRAQNLMEAVLTAPKTFVLTGGRQSVSEIGALLTDSGLGDLTVAVGERLSYPDEKITTCKSSELSAQTFDPLSVMLVFHADAECAPVTHGLPDEAFERGTVPMTKAEVRAASIAKLCLQHGQTVWDVGAGTGSVSVEIARVLPDGEVYAIEKNPQALALLVQNKQRFGVCSMQIVSGSAPDALHELPAPDAVFVGGSSGNLSEIVRLALEKNPQVRIVVNAITLETVAAAVDCFNRFALCGREIVQLTVAKAKAVGTSNMMMGQNPVYILSAGGGQPPDA